MSRSTGEVKTGESFSASGQNRFAALSPSGKHPAPFGQVPHGCAVHFAFRCCEGKGGILPNYVANLFLMHPDPGPAPQTSAIVESFITISNRQERAKGDRAAVHNLFFGRCPLAALLPWKPDRTVLAVLAL